MFQKILIANRGEIALRIIRACRELGIKTVAVYTEVDRDSLHVRYADEDVCIGPGTADAYRNAPQIISAAEITDADAIHPGYGFLAENADFAEICEQCRIKFIGPSAKAIRMMGDKAAARKAMMKAGVPVTPGSKDAVSGLEEAIQVAHEIGYPVMLKAAAGGGGRGMRVAHTDVALAGALATAQAEARAAFGSGEVYLEKLVMRPKHVEIQILADSHGRVIHLGERDCSIQRRHQKLVEESPCPTLDDKLRRDMGAAAIKAARAARYEGAGTVEFLLEDRKFYFMEMNTRIQVEHPVTEELTGIDLIKEQIRIASGEKLGYRQKDIEFRGHVIEFRINAEDPDYNFAPNPGKLTTFHVPGGPGVRIDSHAYSEYVIPPHYDSMIAKLIVKGKNRAEAVRRANRALDEFVVEGIRTTIPFFLKILRNERFLSGDYTTAFVEEFYE
ncbi:MAG TPA: acetyl-CoA carboxylase biotin carboxylase subunit [Candidatus Sumerlaeota bacterium]|nr:MAG: Biotin carboxylase [candidate division BRC1 bacterium ADurb.BinA292]HOE95187.1 acetyl-CoA carboxylase biotin carboxylase subunit [Candidatus Sumerlaeota bacterium]HOR27281.1 acetyl-CoA carboxylase biotin carboxylase subunit [Candidatus Sumerlaeota bacterium]HPK03660.1 acetyl-CoA carboxylase biotin carboxylase subunit [Candidatus Sumerlaeota bacterium]